MRHRLLVALLLAASGCGGHSSLADIQVQQARLDDFDLLEGGLLVGGAVGSAVLVVTDTQGSEYDYPVDLQGNLVGALFQFQSSLALAGKISLPLELGATRPGLTADKLLGRYSGSQVAVEMALGVSSYDLSNGAEVRLDATIMEFGAGMSLSEEWLEISLGQSDGG